MRSAFNFFQSFFLQVFKISPLTTIRLLYFTRRFPSPLSVAPHLRPEFCTAPESSASTLHLPVYVHYTFVKICDIRREWHPYRDNHAVPGLEPIVWRPGQDL